MCLGVPMKIVEMPEADQAIVESGGVTMPVSLGLVDGAQVGDFVVVHAGFAIEVMDLKTAEETLRLLQQYSAGTGGGET